MNKKVVHELLLQSLEHEMGGVKVYTQALENAKNPSLTKEWTKYLKQTKTHVSALQEVFAAMGLDANEESPGRAVVREMGASLVKAMKDAKANADADGAELVACECVVLAETKDHLNWTLIGKCVEHLDGKGVDVLKAAHEKVEEEEDEHLYHSNGFCRELWIKALGMKAVIPPPEEQHKVKTAIGAARAEQEADRHRN